MVPCRYSVLKFFGFKSWCSFWVAFALLFLGLPFGLQSASIAEASELISTPVHFFEGSRRSFVAGPEASFLLEVRRSFEEELRIRGLSRSSLTPGQESQMRQKAETTKVCSAFFVENEDKKLFVGSARHCFKFAEIPMCNEKTTYEFRPLVAPQLRGQCRRIVALSERSDFMIFEIEFPGQDTAGLRRSMSSLAVGVFPGVIPIRHLSIEMFGFPGDSRMKNQPTKSFKCEVQSAPQDAPTDNYFENFKKRESTDHVEGFYAPLVELFRLRARQLMGQMITLRHNCDTFAGNSGGPIVLAGSRMLIGLPASYDRNGQTYSRDKFGLLETPWRLLQDQQAQFQQSKIIMKSLDEGLQQRLQVPSKGLSTGSSEI